MFELFRKIFGAEKTGTGADGGALDSSLPEPAAGRSLERFNDLFVRANKALARGNTEGLKDGIGLLIEALPSAGEFRREVAAGISELRCALSHHDRADTKGPWNRDLSGYGVMSWKNDLYDRDVALRRAWEHLGPVNDQLRSRGLGWNYRDR